MIKHNRVPGWNRIWGLHSNIPECCVHTYITEGARSMPSVRGWGYRPCRNCFNQGLTARVRVHPCTYECRPFLEGLNFSKQDINFILQSNRKVAILKELRRRKIIKESLNLKRIMNNRLHSERGGTATHV